MLCGSQPPRMPAHLASQLLPTHLSIPILRRVTAADASLELDGTTITRETNEISDLLDGIKLTLKSTTSTASLVTAKYDTATASTTMKLILDGINDLNDILKEMGQRGGSAAKKGPWRVIHSSAHYSVSLKVTQQWPSLVSRMNQCI